MRLGVVLAETLIRAGLKAPCDAPKSGCSRREFLILMRMELMETTEVRWPLVARVPLSAYSGAPPNPISFPSGSW
jgi:hypothetical protein